MGVDASYMSTMAAVCSRKGFCTEVLCVTQMQAAQR